MKTSQFGQAPKCRRISRQMSDGSSSSMYADSCRRRSKQWPCPWVWVRGDSLDLFFDTDVFFLVTTLRLRRVVIVAGDAAGAEFSPHKQACSVQSRFNGALSQAHNGSHFFGT